MRVGVTFVRTMIGGLAVLCSATAMNKGICALRKVSDQVLFDQHIGDCRQIDNLQLFLFVRHSPVPTFTEVFTVAVYTQRVTRNGRLSHCILGATGQTTPEGGAFPNLRVGSGSVLAGEENPHPFLNTMNIC